MVLLQVQKFETGTRYDLDILHQCGKRVETKYQKVLGANSHVCGSYRGKTERGLFCPSPSTSWIELKLLLCFCLHIKANDILNYLCAVCYITQPIFTYSKLTMEWWWYYSWTSLFFAEFEQKITKNNPFSSAHLRYENDLEVSTYFLTYSKFKK